MCAFFENGLETPFELPFRLLELVGQPRQRGQVYGESCKSVLNEGIRKWKEVLSDATGVTAERYLSEFLSFTHYRPAIQTWASDLLEEVEGIAEGCGLDYETILAYQLVDEEWWYRSVIHSKNHPHTQTGCSAMGVKGNETQPTYLAQTMDLIDTVDGGQLLLHIKQDGLPDSFVFTLAGMIGLNGMNNLSIGICCNQLVQLESGSAGLPVAFIIRKALQYANFDELLHWITHIPHASGQNYLIGSPQKVMNLECSVNKVVCDYPDHNLNWICHTNHPLINDDTRTFEVLKTGYTAEDRENLHKDSNERLDFLYERLHEQQNTWDSQQIQSILSSQKTPICKGIDPTKDQKIITAFTFGCLVMTLSERPRLDISFGPPCSRPFFQIAFENG